ncbi:MAG: helix-turn-helix domain-containing protein [Chloroflexi bacterium]|nr:helix-turn-helix domain-containing protein [Chloroflexota bacterium]
MPVIFGNQKYYRTKEVCEIAGVSRSTLWRWMKAGILKDSARKDRRGWRLFTEADVKIIQDEAQRVR